MILEFFMSIAVGFKFINFSSKIPDQTVHSVIGTTDNRAVAGFLVRKPVTPVHYMLSKYKVVGPIEAH
jgi:hypothetical protein